VKAVLTDTGKMRVRQGVWHIAFRDHLDREQDIAAFEDEGDSRILAGHIEDLVIWHGRPLPPDLETYCEHLRKRYPRIAGALEACGLLAPKVEAQPEPEPVKPAVWVDDYEGWLRASKAKTGYHRNAVYIQTTMARIRAIIQGAGFQTWRDISKSPVERFLGGLSVGLRTYNGYLKAFKTFCTWCVKDGRAEYSPVQYLELLTVPDKEKRQALSYEAVCKLLQATVNGPRRYNLTGMERAVLYLLGIATGFRRRELAHLTVDCFDLSKAAVRLNPAYCKDRCEAIQPLPMALASLLAGFLAGKGPTERVFNLQTPKTAEMLQADATEAGLPLVDDEGRELVFHSLRHTLRTELVRARVSEAVIDKIMRHKPDSIGKKHYTHVSDFEKREAIERLPEYPWPGTLQQQAVRTGTDDAPAEIYGEKYAVVTHDTTTSVKIAQTTASGGPTTALAIQNQGLKRTGCPIPPYRRMSITHCNAMA
jgi:integrase